MICALMVQGPDDDQATANLFLDRFCGGFCADFILYLGLA